MADYYTVLQRAVAALPENTGAGRRAIYDKARAALVRQLETIQPPLPAAEIAKQRLSLEEAVRRIGGRMKTEASGGINLDTVRAVAETGVDMISVGALTHSAPVLDLGLDIGID